MADILLHNPSAVRLHNYGIEALRQAYKNNYLEVAKVLLQRGTCIDVKNKGGYSMLTECCMMDDKVCPYSLVSISN